MRRRTEQPTITFTCEPDLHGAIPEPIPAAKNVPTWFKKLEAKIPPSDPTDFGGETIKACMPVLDAFHAGYLIPSAAPVRFVVKDGDVTTTWKSRDLKMVDSHSAEQVKGSNWDGPFMKWINPWRIITPPGYSSLITAPVNRPEAHFQCLTAVVDTDTYPNQINFPFLWTGPREYDDIIPAGTPLVQVIPFKREDWGMVVRTPTPDEKAARATAIQRLEIDNSGYRDLWRQAKRWRR